MLNLRHGPLELSLGRHLSSRGQVSILTLRIESQAMWHFIYRCENNFCANSLSTCANHPGLLTGAQYFVITVERSGNPPNAKAFTAPSNPSSTLPSSVEDFVAKVLTLADEAGGFGLIVPSKVLDQIAYSSTREALISKGLNTALDLGNGFFPSITENAALLTGALPPTNTDIQMGALDANCCPENATFESRTSIREKPALLLRAPQVTPPEEGFASSAISYP